jgi:SAM-dependent methyltransferase
VCRGQLQVDDSLLRCSACIGEYPIVDGIPVLINENRSVFSHTDFVRQEETFFRTGSRLRKLIFAMMPEMSINRVAKPNYGILSRLLLERSPKPRVLVLGGSIQGAGMEEFRFRPDFEFIDTDVSFGPLTQVICDAHDIPLPAGSVDGVIAQAVLEHVADPVRCVDEIYRVLKSDGLVYAETPFMQPTHAAPYDFHRFTFIGCRRLFRHFTQIKFGPVGGPGQALGHQWEDCLLCFGRTRQMRAVLYFIARWTGFWLKYLDRFLNRNPHAVHCAFGLYFLGEKVDKCLSDREVIEACRIF